MFSSFLLLLFDSIFHVDGESISSRNRGTSHDSVATLDLAPGAPLIPNTVRRPSMRGGLAVGFTNADPIITTPGSTPPTVAARKGSNHQLLSTALLNAVAPPNNTYNTHNATTTTATTTATAATTTSVSPRSGAKAAVIPSGVRAAEELGASSLEELTLLD